MKKVTNPEQFWDALKTHYEKTALGRSWGEISEYEETCPAPSWDDLVSSSFPRVLLEVFMELLLKDYEPSHDSFQRLQDLVYLSANPFLHPVSKDKENRISGLSLQLTEILGKLDEVCEEMKSWIDTNFPPLNRSLKKYEVSREITGEEIFEVYAFSEEDADRVASDLTEPDWERVADIPETSGYADIKEVPIT